MNQKNKIENEVKNVLLNNRREIIFVYDVIRANPNGDPDDGNRPRMDEQGYNLVTDLRLKRTIRDYWLSQSKQVLIKRVLKDDKKTVMNLQDIVTKELEISDVDKVSRDELQNRLPEKYIDVRTFGAAVTFKNANISITGPVQFGIGKSLNKPEIVTMGLTTVLSSTGEQGAGGMGQFHYVDYSLIMFHGIACEYNSKKTQFSEEDLKNVYEGLWMGTKKLNTRSKFNHNPRLLFAVVSKENEFQIGGLDTKIKLKDEENILSCEDAKVVVDELMEILQSYKDKILKIEFKETKELTYLYKGEEYSSFADLISKIGIQLEEI
ncbi:MAG: type I-B CRISPR-associated protein Cas7/Csh2 [Candidatus Heimdallarchaeum endolithica]|uniref:Type I-B CRISPR-associated protein Cas7/Csh2 n=1 Tax=Candidatus Heimdallarchaeum endolithica TaxID=2876572 RepID=A0A9Y1BTB1_9ARCH|nr:MAG: type I-B CRISPR-associated protein Cas7/Csh2 [Candidatus Heimdallarchaeum endolithica]